MSDWLFCQGLFRIIFWGKGFLVGGSEIGALVLLYLRSCVSFLDFGGLCAGSCWYRSICLVVFHLQHFAGGVL